MIVKICLAIFRQFMVLFPGNGMTFYEWGVEHLILPALRGHERGVVASC